MIYALIEDGIVTQVGVKKIENALLVDDSVIVGQVYDETNETFSNPVIVISMSDHEILELRLTAYSNVSTGSDHLFIEYQAALAEETDDAQEKKTAWLDRRDEIKLEYPFND